MEPSIRLYRKRYIPDECVLLKDDKILSASDSLILTRWNTLKPREDISYGYSAYFLDRGFKVSKMYDRDGNLVYWYCDIIDTIREDDGKTLIFQDLLADVLIYPDGQVRVVDLDEVAKLLLEGVIDDATAAMTLRTLDGLLRILYRGEFAAYQKAIEDAERKAGA